MKLRTREIDTYQKNVYFPKQSADDIRMNNERNKYVVMKHRVLFYIGLLFFICGLTFVITLFYSILFFLARIVFQL
jgi:hypothetical protein